LVGRPSIRRFGPTYILIIINALVYAGTAILSLNPLVIDGSVLALIGQHNARVLNDGWYWQDLFSSRQYLAIYFASGLAGNLLSLLMGPDVVSVGASGAIFGLFGASVIYMRRSVGQSIAGALMYVFYLFVLNIGAGVNLLAHFGGLATGLIIGYSLAHARRETNSVRYSASW
jgi:rhomboid protease GluP